MDIAEVVQKIEKEYALAMKYDKNIASLYDKVSAGTATYAEASKFAEMSGQHIGNILASNLAESFPNGITTEDALQLVPPPLRENHEYVAAVAEQAQKTMNEKAGVGLIPVVPEFDEKRAEDLAEKIADGLSDKQIINECINESRHTVDNSMRVNARAHEQVGMKVRVTREYDGVGLSAGRECTWCLERCGRDMTYSEAYDIGAFERHPGCGCVITYTSRKGVTTVQSKAGGDWEENRRKENIQQSEKRLTKIEGIRKRERLVNLGAKREFGRDFETIRANKLEHYTLNNLYLAENVSLKPREIRAINAQISQAKEILQTSNTCKAPMVIVNDNRILASYNPRKNEFYISSQMADESNIAALQKGFACSNDSRSTMVHELLHWEDAEEYRGMGLIIDSADERSAYSVYERNRAAEALVNAGIDLTDVDAVRRDISQYAADKLVDNNFEEVYTEYRTKQILTME